MFYPKKILNKYIITNTNDIIVSPNNSCFDDEAIKTIFEYNDFIDDLKLLTLAEEARKNSYCPYSNFSVGAALMAENGDIFLGCNIESASHTPDVCAERSAFIKALNGGYTKFKKIAVVGNKVNEKGTYITPCGVCRQFMAEFVHDDFEIITKKDNDLIKYTLEELYPNKFTKHHPTNY